MEATLAFPLLVGLIGVALFFDLLNGLHDAANSIATIVSTRVLRPQYAVLWAAFFNFIAFAFFGLHVAETLGTGIISADIVDPQVVFAALIGAIAWNLLTWMFGIPSSSSHALIGGMVGAGVAKAGGGAIVWSGLLKTSAAIVLSPATGFVLALVLVLAVSWLFVRSTPFAVDRTFRVMQFISASLYSLGHGGNDAQKTMGIIAVLLYSQGLLGAGVLRSVLGGHFLPGGAGARHAARRLAHRPHHGIQDHAPQSDAGFLRGDRRRHHAVCGDMARHSGFDHAHHHRRHRRRRRGAARLGRAVGHRRQYRHRLGDHDTGHRGDRGALLCGCRSFRIAGASVPPTALRDHRLANTDLRCIRDQMSSVLSRSHCVKCEAYEFHSWCFSFR